MKEPTANQQHHAGTPHPTQSNCAETTVKFEPVFLSHQTEQTERLNTSIQQCEAGSLQSGSDTREYTFSPHPEPSSNTDLSTLIVTHAHCDNTPFNGKSPHTYLNPTTRPTTTRGRARRPSRPGSIATRGRTAGFPKRNQTDARQHLRWQDLCALQNAEAFAAANSLILTAHITVMWRSAPDFSGGSAESWETEHRHFLRKMKTWLKARDVAIAYLYVRERCVGRGAHTHFMVHLPPARWNELRGPLQSHLQAVLKARGYTDMNTVMITGGDWHGMARQTQRRGLLRYLAKAINPEELVHTGAGVSKLPDFLAIVPKPQASVPVKRVGWSQNIGETARKAEDWNDVWDVLRLADQMHGQSEATSRAEGSIHS